MTQRPSVEQLRVLTLLNAAPDGRLDYYRGGFWGPPGQKTVGPHDAPEKWWTSTQTVRGMQRKGWLVPVPGTEYKGYPDLCARYLTAEGRTVASKYLLASGSVKPVVAA